jgi:SAM-dependent methyltransferase
MSDPSVDGPSDPAYSLGHSERELERLASQARLVDPITRRFLIEAGVAPGMRVLDVGSGAGDVAFIAADLVGATGEVVGTDRAPAALSTARRRAEAGGRTNVSFREVDPAEMPIGQLFDAVVGRYVLMHQPDPIAMLRGLVGQVRPGGVVVFHEPYRADIHSFPVVPGYDRGTALVSETSRRSGSDPQMGMKLYATFIAAGLPAPSMRLESLIAGGARSADHVHYEMDVLVTLIPVMERLGLVTAADGDLTMLAERVVQDVIANDSVVVGRAEIGAWTRR